MAILSDADETLVISALRFQANGLVLSAKNRGLAGDRYKSYRASLRAHAAELRALADRLEEGQRIHAQNMSVLSSYRADRAERRYGGLPGS
jgi:hypothetical protein